MSNFISLLRGINVGGQKMLRMENLREIYLGLGFANVRSYVQSGNVLFDSPEQDVVGLVKQIESRIEHVCGYHVAVFIRTVSDLQEILHNNPFNNLRHEDPTRLHVTFLYKSPPDPNWSRLAPPEGIADEFAPAKRAIYLFCPNGYGKTKLSNSFFERKLGMPVTTRNWNTVNALVKMAMD